MASTERSRCARLLWALVALTGCLDLDWRMPGEPCARDEQCFGRCVEVEGRRVCHGETPRGADPGAPCLRPELPGESGCDARVRAGRWVDERGDTVCRVTTHRFREEADNRCDDDNDGLIDEPYEGACGGGFRRGVFEGRASPASTAFADMQYGFGGRFDGQPQPSGEADPTQVWVLVTAEGRSIGGIIAESCRPAPATPEDVRAYPGPRVRWILPALDIADRFRIIMPMLRLSSDTLGRPAYGPLSGVQLWHEDAAGRLTRVPIEIDKPTSMRPMLQSAGCVALSAGINMLHLIAHTEGGCPCDQPECPDAVFVAPLQAQFDR